MPPDPFFWPGIFPGLSLALHLTAIFQHALEQVFNGTAQIQHQSQGRERQWLLAGAAATGIVIWSPVTYLRVRRAHAPERLSGNTAKAAVDTDWHLFY